ncbi:MAG: tetratricopeptide repeat protein [Calditrichae bacterium]|nr:tetratricopeptide repeat protein [Calditrichia bacterium]
MTTTLYRILFLLLLSVFVLTAQESETSFMAAGDQAFKSFDNQTALDNYLKVLSLNKENYEASWKTSRAYIDLGEKLDDSDKRAEFYKKGEQYARDAIKIDPEGSMGHLYLSIALGRVALDASAKERIKMSKEIKVEADLAIKFDPQNDIAYHVLGRWNRKIANLSWIERGFADMFLGGVPKDASNEAAVQNFKKAIELNPNYINHYLELGLTYELMDKDDLAIEAFKKCLELPETSDDDAQHKITAKEQLEDLQ